MIVISRFYVYEWYIKETGEVFYVGKGTGERKDVIYNRNDYFKSVHNKYACSNRVIENNLTDEEACNLERDMIKYYWDKGQAKCNFTQGGTGFAEGELNPIHKRIKSPDYVNPFSYLKFEGSDNHFYGKKHSEETKRKISESRKGSRGLSGKDNPMYGKGFKGKDNPMYGVKGFDNHNSIMYHIAHSDDNEEYLTSKQCEIKFGIAFERIRGVGGILHYKNNSKNKKLYEGLKVNRVE